MIENANKLLGNPPLDQRTHASIDFLAAISATAAELKGRVKTELSEAVAEPDLADDLPTLCNQVETALAASPALRWLETLRQWHRDNHAAIAVEAFAAMPDTVRTALDALDHGPAELQLDPAVAVPDYWDGVEFHCTEGGWDGHPYMGYIHGEIIHQCMVDRIFPGGIFKQRRHVAALAPRDAYARILDMGCSTGHFTKALAETYPAAEISGVDLSARALEQARRVANANGWGWKLYQRPAEATGLAAESFDLVGSYIVLHEMPVAAIRALFAEAFRLLAPGGHMLMSDVTRADQLSKFDGWWADFAARRGGEPYWRESSALDLKAAAEAAGFTEVKAWGEGPANYPYIVMGRKPE